MERLPYIGVINFKKLSSFWPTLYFVLCTAVLW